MTEYYVTIDFTPVVVEWICLFTASTAADLIVRYPSSSALNGSFQSEIINQQFKGVTD